jgi:predicted secreted protein
MAKKIVTEHIDGRELLKNPLEAEYRAFRKMLPRLLKKYKDEYVAIYQGKLLGHHPDDRELARRAYKKVGDVPFLLTKVSRNWPEIMEFPSPELILPQKRRKKMAKNVVTKTMDGRELLKDPLENEYRAFRKMLPRLLKRYKGEHVAFYQGKLLGHHPDRRELARQTFKMVGHVPFLLTKVTKSSRIDELPSPEEF